MTKRATAGPAGPDWSITGQMWVADTSQLDEHFLPAVDAALDNLGATFVLTRWDIAQADAALVERWYTQQRAMLRAELHHRIGDSPLRFTLGHNRSIDANGAVWQLRTVRVNRARPTAVRAAS